jgi:hypothetical protein
MLTSGETEDLLGVLCVKFGFCIPTEDWNRLVADPPSDVEAFANEVYKAECLDPMDLGMGAYRAMKREIAKAFHRHFDSEFQHRMVVGENEEPD